MTAKLKASELPLGAVKQVFVDDVAVAVANTEEGVFAIEDTCSHAEVSLSEGSLSGCLLECWMHGAAFDVRTGQPVSPPASRPVDTYEVQIADEFGEPIYLISKKES